MALHEAACLVDSNLSVKIGIGVYVFGNTILSLGTERHLPIFDAVWNKKVILLKEIKCLFFQSKIT